MTRVIAGAARGIRLRVPKGDHTRPTADRVKESLFSMLGHAVIGARVLDLYAGTGALGIEALSRGAQEAVFVEKDRLALQCIQQNLTACRLSDQAQIIRSRRLPDRHRLGDTPFDLIFADPPYEQGYFKPLFSWIDTVPPVRDGTLFIVEHSNKEEIPLTLKNFSLNRRRVYGDTTLTLWQAHGPFRCGDEP